MIETGTVLTVAEIILGSELAADAPVGSTVLTVQDAAAFSVEGGRLQLAGVTYEYLTADVDADTVTLATATTAAAFADDLVAVVDAASGTPATQTRAIVRTFDPDLGDEGVEAIVPFVLRSYLPLGIRDPGVGETVTLEWQGSVAYVQDVIGQAPTVLEEALPPIDAGSQVYYGPTAPWPDGDTAHDDNGGDVWYLETVTVDDDGNQLTSYTPHLWDATNRVWVDASDPQVDLLGGIADTLDETVADLSTRVDSVSATATSARDLATTADGRVSFSDYDPAPEDISYLAFDLDGQPIIDPATGQQQLIQRQPGSVWFTRTRDRRNYATNPSAEVDLAGWQAVGGAGLTRVSVTPDPAVGGSWGVQVANQATVPGGATWPALPVQPGQPWALSTFVQLVSGDGSGVHLHYRVKDTAGTVLLEQDGPSVTAPTVGWVRVSALLTIPTNGVLLEVEAVAAAAAVWRIDGVLLEQDAVLGRYFDGESEAASWDGPPHAAQSILAGGLITDVYELYAGSWVRMDFTGTTQYDSDASDLLKGTLNPARIADQSLPIDKQATNSVVAFEAIAAGKLVHVFDNNGVINVRLADASSGREAHGFVVQAASVGQAVPVYHSGYDPFVTGLAAGTCWLGEDGAVTQSPPSGTNAIVQQVGFASDTAVLHFTAGPAIRLL